MEIKKGDIIEVKNGILEPEFGEFELSGWKGEVTDTYKYKGEDFIEINWTIETINEIPIKFIEESIKDDYSFSEMHLSQSDVIKINQTPDDKKERERLIMKLEQKYSSSGDQEDKRIATILEKLDLSVNKENLIQYRDYLIDNLVGQIILTGIEDFSWEEKYLFGYGSKQEYEELKKEKPSYKDQFKLLKILDVEDGEVDLFARVSRISDLKKFEMPLSDLKHVDRKSKYYEILNDFSVWIVNY